MFWQPSNLKNMELRNKSKPFPSLQSFTVLRKNAVGKKEKPVLDLAVICVCCTGIPRLSGGAADPRTSFHSQKVSSGLSSSLSSLWLHAHSSGWTRLKNVSRKEFRMAITENILHPLFHLAWCSATLGNSSLCPHSSELLFLPSNLLTALIFTLLPAVPASSGEMNALCKAWRWEHFLLLGAMISS